MDEQANQRKNHGKTGRWAFWGFVLIAGFFLIIEHRAHLLGILPYLLLLACVFMHMFHRHDHGHDSHEHDRGTTDSGGNVQTPARRTPFS